jgi:hypothetical protein
MPSLPRARTFVVTITGKDGGKTDPAATSNPLGGE